VGSLTSASFFSTTTGYLTVVIICLSLLLLALLAFNVYLHLRNRARARVAVFSPIAQTNLGEIVVLNDSPEGHPPAARIKKSALKRMRVVPSESAATFADLSRMPSFGSLRRQ
jgi:hypothetical protein